MMRDERPAARLNIRPQDLARRAALEQRKLREMISFCYTERCYRAFILDYFGDRHHAPRCGTCGNCIAPQAERRPVPVGDVELDDAPPELRSSAAAASAPLDPPTRLDRFVREHAPVALDLERELDEQSRFQRARARAEAEALAAVGSTVHVTQARELAEDERLTVRKILACAARMDGRFGKGILAAALRGSRQAKILQAGLDRLSTYGLLAHMTQDEIMSYVDALVAAGCLHVTGGAYPTVALTALGDDVMRERAQVQLALPLPHVPPPAAPRSTARTTEGRAQAPAPPAPRVSTVDETYAFYEAGMTIEEIAQERTLTVMTVEKHLAECIVAGRPFDITRHVNAHDRALIEQAVTRLGPERLKPLRDQLPRHVTYRMIRFVVADLERAAKDEST
jgi:ATP-dependent DNA helicase RecQ